MNASFGHRLLDLGALRLMLYVAAVLCLLLRPAPGTPAEFSGWGMFPTLIAPITVPLVIAVLGLDAIMARVMATDPEHGPPARYRLAIRLDLLFVIVLIAWWLPYFRAIGE